MPPATTLHIAVQFFGIRFAKHASMLSHVYSASLQGIDASLIKVEVDVRMQGLPGWSMVGLLETAVKEARDRVSSAIRNSGYHLPNRKTIVNLSPADIKKAGAHFDLAIALGLLHAVGVCHCQEAKRYLIAGELSLTGSVLPINGALMMALLAKLMKLDGLIIPEGNAHEASIAEHPGLISVSSLVEAVEALQGHAKPERTMHTPNVEHPADTLDLSEVRGQPLAKRGLEIAAAGGHNLALKGPPGTGKTMLAERIPSILPPLSQEEALEVLKIRSWHGLTGKSFTLPSQRPFRAPHHSASYAGLIGGGRAGQPQLGEISLSHHGVLFLDEMAEFRKDVLEVLRQPMESGIVRIVRSGVNLTYPARFMLVAAFNPCPCGFLGHPRKSCTCSILQLRRYRSKLSGPLLDRIDLHIEVAPPPHEALLEGMEEESSQDVRRRVLRAREIQQQRYDMPGFCNAHLSSRTIATVCHLTKENCQFLRAAAHKHDLSGRALHRVLKVARTIADLAESPLITIPHLAEAVRFRAMLHDPALSSP